MMHLEVEVQEVVVFYVWDTSGVIETQPLKLKSSKQDAGEAWHVIEKFTGDEVSNLYQERMSNVEIGLQLCVQFTVKEG